MNKWIIKQAKGKKEKINEPSGSMSICIGSHIEL